MAQVKETAVVYSQEELAPEIFSMWITTETAKEAKPGQFISVGTARTAPDCSQGRSVSVRPIRRKEDCVLCISNRRAGTKEFFFHLSQGTPSISWALSETVFHRRAKMSF